MALMYLVVLVDTFVGIMSTSSDTYIWATRGEGTAETVCLWEHVD